jgi:UDP-GlcNAc3NAcA epimerase
MKIVTVIGARPQFINASPVSRATERHNPQGYNQRVSEILVHTGQHYDYIMSQVFLINCRFLTPNTIWMWDHGTTVK